MIIVRSEHRQERWCIHQHYIRHIEMPKEMNYKLYIPVILRLSTLWRQLRLLHASIQKALGLLLSILKRLAKSGPLVVRN